MPDRIVHRWMAPLADGSGLRVEVVESCHYDEIRDSLRELDRYAEHRDTCNLRITYRLGECTCGLTAARRACGMEGT